MCIAKELVKNRIENFLGYGNIKSDFWFFGIEEATNGDKKGLEQRFEQTFDKKILDCYEDMINVPEHIVYYSGHHPKIQKTESVIIRILLNITSDLYVDKEIIREFQKSKFGRKNSNHCSLELLPLPNPKNDKWIYNCVDIDFLESRRKYESYIIPKRIKIFRDLILENNPKIVIFFGVTYKNAWKEISQINYRN